MECIKKTFSVVVVVSKTRMGRSLIMKTLGKPIYLGNATTKVTHGYSVTSADKTSEASNLEFKEKGFKISGSEIKYPEGIQSISRHKSFEFQSGNLTMAMEKTINRPLCCQEDHNQAPTIARIQGIIRLKTTVANEL